MRRFVFILVLSLVAVFTAFSAGQAESTEGGGTIRIFSQAAAEMGSEGFPVVFRAAKERAEAKNPGFTYEITGISHENFRQQVAVELAAGTEADIIHVDAPLDILTFHRIKRGGSFIDLAPYVAQTDLEKNINGYAMGTVNGQQLAIPSVAMNWTGFFIRKSLFEEAGVSPTGINTWEEYIELLKKLARDTTGDGRSDRFGMSMSTTGRFTRWWSQQWFWTVGGGWFEDDTNGPWTSNTVAFDSPENIYVLETLLEIYNVGTPVGLREQNPARELFYNGITAIQADGPYLVNQIKQAGEGVFEDTGIMKMPGTNFGGRYRKPATPVWGLSWTISSGSKHPDEAFDWIEYTFEKDQQDYLSQYNVVSFKPTIETVFAELNPLASEMVQWGFSDEFELVRFPMLEQYQELDMVHQQVMGFLFSGQKTPAEAADWGQKEMKNILQ